MNTPEAYEHFKLIRENPSYRNYIMLEEMRAEQEPAWGLIPEEPEVIVKKIYPYVSVDMKALELQKRIVALENELNKHLDKKPSTKYIYSSLSKDNSQTQEGKM